MHTMTMFFIVVLVCFLCIMVFINKRSILSVLILLEALMYGVILTYMYPMLIMFNSLSYMVALFCIAAAGAACGLSLLVTFSRYSGNDFITSLRYA